MLNNSPKNAPTYALDMYSYYKLMQHSIYKYFLLRENVCKNQFFAMITWPKYQCLIMQIILVAKTIDTHMKAHTTQIR